ncbi:D-alanine--D-alanine ligase family protein [Kineosporia succinea]|uniref:D-alanine--D-alanine ligase n=1 Tax=Kineosporia succinea TaxID=84632 RepID=A0ABT9PDI0_9ACTN|nr:D-alanine--D-alanine ligase family protein [Kineosporia succinea]MDP9830755.1 D-alanine-D-alanine ligase [Kineosporia succinea]
MGKSSRKIAVLFGGPGPEHEVSLGSAGSVLAELDVLGWDVLAVGIGKDGRWFTGPGSRDLLITLADPEKLPLGVAASTEPAGPRTTTYPEPPPRSAFEGYDLVLPLCHGRWGEDGTLQGLLATYGLKVIGCGVTSSAVCFDKQVTKAVLTAAGIPVTPGVAVRRRAWTQDPEETGRVLAKQIGAGPWFVKPNRSGSSIGVTAVERAADLPAAIDEALHWDDVALVEEFVPHRELLLGVVGTGEALTVSPPLEAIQAGEFLDYTEKYRGGQLRFDPPAGVGPEVIERARQLATEAFEALGCEVFARVDLFLDTRDGSLLVNEVNTIPGMTAQSAFAQLMAQTGLPFGALLETLHQLTEEAQ